MKLHHVFALGIMSLISTNFARAADFDHSHTAWDKWLKQYATVSGSATTIDYKAAKNSSDGLNGYLKIVSEVTKEQYQAFSEPNRLAFLINAYNAFTVKLILDNYPVKSIKDIGSLFKSPWKKKFFNILGEEQNLDGIEHEMIRKQFNEPRIHFSVVCASIGCPQLRGEAFIGAKLEQQFEGQVASFLKDSTRNRWDGKEGKFYLSKIFDWYGGDFVKKFGTVQQFLAPRMGANAEEQSKMKEAGISFLDYNWNLNETPSKS